MISRRYFLKTLGVGALLTSTTFSFVQNVYAQSVQRMTDFGGLIYKSMKGFVDDTGQAQNLIKKSQILHPRGTGHSQMGQSLRKNAYSFSPEETDITFKDNLVTASGITMLLDIDNFLEKYDRMLPVSPDHRTLSLGGVLSVGGYGIESLEQGGLVDHVVAMTVMDKGGRIKDLKPHHDLFDKVLCGIGQHGIILTATIKTSPRNLTVILKKKGIRTVGEYDTMVNDFLNLDKDNPFNIFYSIWNLEGGWVFHGRSTTFDNVKNVLQNKKYFKSRRGVIIEKDYRVYRKEQTDSWAFGKPFKYYVWSDHSVEVSGLKAQMNAARQLQKDITSLGGEANMYSVLTKVSKGKKCISKDLGGAPVISVGVYSNFLPHQKEQAKQAAKLQIEYSKISQLEREACPYRYGWYWDRNKEFDESQFS